MAVHDFTAENKYYSDIMSNGIRYQVPKFQRNYAWGEEQWEELWADVIEAINNPTEEYYMGYLVFQPFNEEKRAFSVIDGQQRLTTITILMLTILGAIRELAKNNIEKLANEQRYDNLHSQYIGYVDPVTLTSIPRLTLNAHNDEHFRTYLCSFRKHQTRQLTPSKKLLQKSYDFFVNKVQSLGYISGEQFAQFAKDISDKLIFTVITVANDLKAYKVFETLNARGVKLSTPDLLKNYLYSVIDIKEPIGDMRLLELDRYWKDITEQLGDNDFSRFIGVEWNSRNPIIQKHSLFKAIRDKMKDGQVAFAYLQRLSESAEIYAALQHHADEFWSRPEYSAVSKSLQTLERFNILQPQIVLLAAYPYFTADKFIKIARYLEVVSVRYNIISHQQTSRQEVLYNKLARDITSGKTTTLLEIRNALQDVYPSDKDFRAAFTAKTMPTMQTPKRARYILAQLEYSVNNGIAPDEATLSLEHILPINPKDQSWCDIFSSQEMEIYAGRLGNMTLLTKKENRELGNTSFITKKVAFASSPLAITRQCSEYDEWNPQTVESRQKWLADIAVNCWKTDE